MSDQKDKIVAGMSDAVRHAKGEDVGARVTAYCKCGETVRNCALETAAAAVDQTAARFDKLASDTPAARDLLSNLAQGARHAAAEVRALKTVTA